MSPRGCFGVTVVVLVVYSVARSFGVFGSDAFFGGIGLTLVLAAITWKANLSRSALGLAREDAGDGLWFGLMALAVVTVAVAAFAALPGTASFLDDPRVDVPASQVLYEVMISILVGTVIPEELAFRGVLLASGLALWDERRAVLISSGLFGLWHIGPTLDTIANNHELGHTIATTSGEVLVVAGSVLITFVAGLIFCWLRRRSRSLLAPIIAHLAINGVAFVVAWVVAAP